MNRYRFIAKTRNLLPKIAAETLEPSPLLESPDTVHGNLDHWLSSTSALKVVFGGAESHETNPQETQRRI